MEAVTIRLNEDEIALVDRLAEETGSSRGDAVRRAASRGAQEELLQIALDRYRDGEIGLRGVAALADLSIGDAMAEANERNVQTNFDEAGISGDVQTLR